MKKLKFSLRLSVLVLGFVHLCLWCNGQDGTQTAPMEKTEQMALYNAVQGFVGKWWNGSDLYPDPCGWTPIQGVSCDLMNGFWYVTELSVGPVEDNSISCAENVEFNPDLFALKHLKSLSFFKCFVSKNKHPVTIPHQNWEILAGSLHSLEFRSNPGLVGEIPESFGKLRNLQSLVLMENRLSGEIPASIGNLTNLNRLNLCGNSLSGRIPDNLGFLNQVLILDLSRNSLSGFVPSSFGGLTALLKLDLSYNNIEGKVPMELGNLKNLTLLDLSNNKLRSGLAQSIQELRSLEELILSNNPIGGDLTNVKWDNLVSLTALDLSNSSLTGTIPESLAELKRLRFLGLNDNKLTGEIPTNLASLPNVSAIYLHGNNLTGVLGFAEWFYGRMGRRFGAWGNPNLCYPTGLMQEGYIPFGVKQCNQMEQVRKYQTLVDYNPESSSGLSASWGCGLLVVVEVFLILVFHFSLLSDQFT